MEAVPSIAQTSILCAICKKKLVVRRTCYSAYLRCECCEKDFPLQEYIKDMDPALEEFLESINCDRI
ncbi:MAG: hypothetical protein LBD42_02955 [Desulfovibrio sp.]|nr:hypothetical protein [Desulfovibrio sp.]